MRIAVYVPLLLSLAAPLGARLFPARCEPRLATWLLTVSAVVLGAASTVSLGLLAVAGLIRVPLLAALGHWSLHAARLDDPTTLSVSVIAGLLLGGAAAAALRMLWRRARSLASAALEAACLPTRDGLVIIEDEAPDAYALPGLPGRIVVSTGMLDTLDAAEHDVLLAHERAHLASHHYLFVAFAQLGAAVNPLLRPLATAVAYTRGAVGRRAGGGRRRRPCAGSQGRRQGRAGRTPAVGAAAARGGAGGARWARARGARARGAKARWVRARRVRARRVRARVRA